MWELDQLKKSYACNSDILMFFRTRRGFSQQKLAERTDLSVRVISKAEAGQAISNGSVAKIAGALRTNAQEVFPEDLISFPLELSKRFIAAQFELKEDMMDLVGEMVDPKAIFRIVGDPERIPFAGTHQGVRAYRRSLKKYFQIVEIPDNFDHHSAFEYFTNGTEVVSWGTTLVRPAESSDEPEPIQHRIRMRFQRGRLISFEDIYDVTRGEKFTEIAARKVGDEIYDPLEDSRDFVDPFCRGR